MSSAVRISEIAFGKYPDAVEICNATVDLVVVPQIGRICRFGFVGEKNLLFDRSQDPVSVNGWTNYGGDKVWIAPQSLWDWPPDTDLDGSAHDLTVLDDGVEIRSPLCSRFGIRVTRTIRMATIGSLVTFENRFLKETGSPVKVAPWQVSQVIQPEWAELELRPNKEMPTGLHVYATGPDPDYHSLSEGLFRAKCNPQTPYKFGAAGLSGRIRAAVDGVYFSMTSPYLQGEEY